MRKKVLLALVLAVAFLLGESCATKKKQVEFKPDGVHCKVDAHCPAGKVCIDGLCKKPIPKGETPPQKARRLIKEAGEALAKAYPDCQTALAKYDEAISIIPEYDVPEIQYNRALCMFYEGKISEAEEVFRKLYKKDKDNEKYLLGLGRVLVVWHKYKDALKLYKDYLKRHPRAIDVRANYATLLRVMGKDDEALRECREIFIQDPSHPSAFNNMALIFYKQGKVGLAKWVLTQGIYAQRNAIKLGKRKREDANLFVNLGAIQLEQGRIQSAIEKFKYAQQVDPLNLGANLNMGNIALQNYDYEEAARCYELALRFDPQNEDAMFGLAIAYRGLGKYEEAEKLYTKLLEKHPKDYKLLWNLGVLYFEFLKNKEKADEMFRRFLRTKKGTKNQRLQAKVYLESEPVQEAPKEQHEWVDPVICVRCKEVCPDVQPCEEGQECPPLPQEKQKCAPCQKCPSTAFCEKCKEIDCTPKDCSADEECPPPPPECPRCAICDGIKEIECQLHPEQCQPEEQQQEGATEGAEGQAKEGKEAAQPEQKGKEQNKEEKGKEKKQKKGKKEQKKQQSEQQKDKEQNQNKQNKGEKGKSKEESKKNNKQKKENKNEQKGKK